MKLTRENPVPVSSDFVFVGEHPAVDFANTRVVAHGEPLDLLASWADVTRWLTASKLGQEENLRVSAERGHADLNRVIVLRDAWKKELGRLAEGKTVREAFVHHLNTLLAVESFHETLHVHEKKGFHVTRSGSKLKGGQLALALIARQTMQFLVEADLKNVRRCANHDSCVLYFYDTTKNHRRQWCSTATCGNRHKVAAFRAREGKRSKSKRSAKS